jgi:hypothetical protein
MFLNARMTCSFCGKSAEEVAKLVAGPKAYICDMCVATAMNIMSDSDGTIPSALSSSPKRWQRVLDGLSRLFGRLGSRDSRGLAGQHNSS